MFAHKYTAYAKYLYIRIAALIAAECIGGQFDLIVAAGALDHNTIDTILIEDAILQL